jgi:hypothetical protein
VSLTSPIPTADGIAHVASGERCFYCGASLRDPAVHWMGATGDVYLHPPCVVELSIRLFRDLHELRCPDFYRRLQPL